ncbi:hypothetical protein ACCW94_21940 [Enterobacter soli]|uniref:hypothetical protein n=1 Tax=Enterobacter soli TaxID=885040 RepID=UPI003EDACCF9
MEILIDLTENDNTGKKNELLTKHQYTHYFSSRLHEIAFLLKINNPKFDKELDIKPIHKINPKKALDLKKRYLNIFHPDKNIDNKISDLNFDEICMDIERTFFRVTSGKLK